MSLVALYLDTKYEVFGLICINKYGNKYKFRDILTDSDLCVIGDPIVQREGGPRWPRGS